MDGDETPETRRRMAIDAYESPEHRRMPLIFVEVAGGCDDDLLGPITIKTFGAPGALSHRGNQSIDHGANRPVWRGLVRWMTALEPVNKQR